MNSLDRHWQEKHLGSVQTDISRILQTDVDKRKTEEISSDRKHFKQTLIETTKQTPAKRNN